MLKKIQTLVLLLLLMGSEMAITGHFLHLTHIAYYGDSLCWAIPSNLNDMVEPLLQALPNFYIKNYSVLPISVSPSRNKQVANHFYPLQTCSDMCGVIVMCMAAVMCERWENWTTWSSDSAPKYLSTPSQYRNHLRISVISWLVANKVNTENLGSATQMACGEGTTDIKQPPVEEKTEDITVCYQPSLVEKISDDATSDSEINSGDENLMSVENSIINMLPSKYEYIFIDRSANDINSHNFNCIFKIKLETEEEARKWISNYNEKTHETMVFERNAKGKGKRILRKLYLRCQHNQRQTGKHTKSARTLKTVHKEHNLKDTNCPAKLTLTILVPHKRHHGHFIEVSMKHTHNHLIEVADALRFRPMSADTKSKYYDLFRQGHSPASAHLEYETNLMYCDDPQLALADRNTNPKLSDVYNLFNKWRKTNLGVRTGKELFTDLEKRVNVYNDEHRGEGGRALIQRFCRKEGKVDDQPLVLSICTPLMARVHKYIQQSCELVFIDSSCSFEDLYQLHLLQEAYP